MLFRPMRMLADKFNILQVGIVAGERIFNLIDRTDHIEDKGNLTVDKMVGKIQFQNVFFSYDGENDVLSDINFEVDLGDTLAVVGSKGSGKTTLINIQKRNYEINRGALRIDDVNIKEYQLDTLRQHIGAVLQDVFLFT